MSEVDRIIANILNETKVADVGAIEGGRRRKSRKSLYSSVSKTFRAGDVDGGKRRRRHSRMRGGDNVPAVAEPVVPVTGGSDAVPAAPAATEPVVTVAGGATDLEAGKRRRHHSKRHSRRRSMRGGDEDLEAGKRRRHHSRRMYGGQTPAVAELQTSADLEAGKRRRHSRRRSMRGGDEDLLEAGKRHRRHSRRMYGGQSPAAEGQNVADIEAGKKRSRWMKLVMKKYHQSPSMGLTHAMKMAKREY